MRYFRLLDKYLEETLLVVMMIYFVIIVNTQVISRYVLGSSITWSEESARYIFVWMAFLGTSLAAKRGTHIVVDIIDSLLPTFLKRFVDILAKLLFILFVVIMCKAGFDVVMKLMQFSQKSPALGLEMFYVYAAVPVGMLLTTLRLIQHLIKSKGELGGTS